MRERVRRVSSLFITAPLLCMVGLSLFLGLLYRQRDLTILSFLVFAVVGGLRLWASASFFRLHGYQALDRHKVFPGEEVSFEARLENSKFLPVWLELRVSLEGLRHASRRNGTELTGETGLLWYQAAGFQWELTAERRGVHQVGPLSIASGDLFGFFPKEKEIPGSSLEVIVYPRLVPLGNLSMPKRDFFGTPGDESPVKDPVYILGTTDYHQGRPAKYIHWKASARHHRLQEKVFEPSRQEKVLLVVDVGGFTEEGAAGEPFERMLEVVASLAVQLDRRGCPVGLLTNGSFAGEGKGFLHVARNSASVPDILEVLARLQPTPRSSVVQVVDAVLPLSWGVSCAYFAFAESPGTHAAVERLKRLRVPVTFFTLQKIGDMTNGMSGYHLSDQGTAAEAGAGEAASA